MNSKIECNHEAKKLTLDSIKEKRTNKDREVTFSISLKCMCGEKIYFGSSYLLDHSFTEIKAGH